ncbi:MAG: hypothetical protein WA667_29910 [Candidatus Nitrosopolaris sp.]
MRNHHCPNQDFLLVSVDVAEGAAVTFDSYETEDGSRNLNMGRISSIFGTAD